MKFSVSNQAFYASEFDFGDSLPADAIDITPEQYESFYNAKNNGCYIYQSSGELISSVSQPDDYYSWDIVKNEWVMTEADISRKKTDAINLATEKKSQIISNVSSTTQILQTQLLLGLISDEDKASLTEWMHYLKNVQAVDVSQAPAIIWPTAPGAESSSTGESTTS